MEKVVAARKTALNECVRVAALRSDIDFFFFLSRHQHER